MTPHRIALCWIAIWLSGLLTYDYYIRIESPSIDRRVALHHAIVSGTAAYQVRYRVLLPYTAEAIARLIQHLPIIRSYRALEPVSYSYKAFKVAYCFLNLTALFIMFGSLGELVCLLFTYELALFGVSISAVLVNFTFRNHYFHPWSFWEGAFFALELLLIYRQQYWLFSGVSVLALINRETSLFLLLAFLFYTLARKPLPRELWKILSRRDVRFAIGNLIVWGLGFAVLHVLIGYRRPTFFVETALNGNFHNWKYAVLLNVLLIGCILPIVVKGVFLAPSLIRQSAIMVPAYFGLLIVIGYWWEIRYWISVIPIVVPALIAALAWISTKPFPPKI